jgi:hypothetical protein
MAGGLTVVLFNVRAGFHRRVKLGIVLEIEETAPTPPVS